MRTPAHTNWLRVMVSLLARCAVVASQGAALQDGIAAIRSSKARRAAAVAATTGVLIKALHRASVWRVEFIGLLLWCGESGLLLWCARIAQLLHACMAAPAAGAALSLCS